MTLRINLAATLSGVALLAASFGPAIAQDAGTTAAPEQPAMVAPATDFSDAQIGAFAVAYVEVMEIGMAFEQQMQTAETDEDLTSLQFEAQQQMVAAVEGIDGLSVDEYNAVLTAAQADPALAEQIQDEVDTLLAE
ncbi:DUF4168 domain-containing protein [Pelagibacterium luteolum]|uniref:DUF4168 domain-containing protein n=1 Tax=Pelagibacterium luteolum TaxID=440168 RepID=A0A1G7ZDG9_9HYPH|nr:DUF4168 domain-containing protein [Pelagibacterium luteolum]SDH06781.1 protein of unknown function [Pelagibacterium luteolum]